MSSHPDTFSVNNAWYSEEGAENDVVLSTRVRLARNLANFAFPSPNRKEDAQRVQSLVFDVFSVMADSDRYQCVSLSQLEPVGRQLLVERGILPEKDLPQRNINQIGLETTKNFDLDLGLVVRTDGRVSCLVNAIDHVRMASFASGYEPRSAWQLCSELDLEMQKKIQFAASYDFGFLTSELVDSGSGMKMSAWVMVPALMQLRRIKETAELLAKQNCTITPALGNVSVPFGALGACYQVTARSAFYENEEELITDFTVAISQLCATERKARNEFYSTKPTVLQHLVCRMLSIAKNSRFLDCSEAIEIISVLQLALGCGLLTGITYQDLHVLMFRVRNSCVDFLRRSSNFIFEDDVKDDVNLMIPRLRSFLVQEAVEDVKICF